MSHNPDQPNNIFSAETADKSPDSFISRHKKAIGVIIAAATLFVGGMIFQNSRSETTVDQPETELPADQGEIKAPREAKEFVDQYLIRYGGTREALSVYYSNKAYEKANSGKSLVLTDEYIESYVPIGLSGETIPNVSEHGFTRYNLPKDMAMDRDGTVAIFNEYMAPQLSLYMNLLAKNMTPKAKAIIDEEFEKYCSTSVTADDEMFKKLKNLASNIVSQNYSGSTYEIKPIILGGSEVPENESYMNEVAIPQNWQDEIYINRGEKTDFASVVVDRLVIDMNTFDGKDMSSKQIKLYNLQIDFMRLPTNQELGSSTPISIGLTNTPELY
jgi:hypothetical protein